MSATSETFVPSHLTSLSTQHLQLPKTHCRISPEKRGFCSSAKSLFGSSASSLSWIISVGVPFQFWISSFSILLSSPASIYVFQLLGFFSVPFQLSLVSPSKWGLRAPNIKILLKFLHISWLNNWVEFTDYAMYLFSEIFGMCNLNGLTRGFSMDRDWSTRNNSHFLPSVHLLFWAGFISSISLLTNSRISFRNLGTKIWTISDISVHLEPIWKPGIRWHFLINLRSPPFSESFEQKRFPVVSANRQNMTFTVIWLQIILLHTLWRWTIRDQTI